MSPQEHRIPAISVKLPSRRIDHIALPILAPQRRFDSQAARCVNIAVAIRRFTFISNVDAFAKRCLLGIDGTNTGAEPLDDHLTTTTRPRRVARAPTSK